MHKPQIAHEKQTVQGLFADVSQVTQLSQVSQLA